MAAAEKIRKGTLVRHKKSHMRGLVTGMNEFRAWVRWEDGEYSVVPLYTIRRSYEPMKPARLPNKNPGYGKAFTFHGSFTSKLAAKRAEAKVPGSFLELKDGRYYLLKPKRIRSTKSNPAVVKIYGRCLRIEAVKTVSHEYAGKSVRAGQRYFHDFRSKNAVIYGLPDGSLLIKAGRG